MNPFPAPFPQKTRWWLCAALLLAVGLSNTGCQLYRTLGSGQRIEPKSKSRHNPSDREQDIQAEIITDASGAVASVRFVRSSGSSAVDDYVVESIKSSWQRGPSMKSLVELTYSQAKGFSEPKLISEAPVQ